jgi:hypothetical protein
MSNPAPTVVPISARARTAARNAAYFAGSALRLLVALPALVAGAGVLFAAVRAEERHTANGGEPTEISYLFTNFEDLHDLDD